MMSAMPNGAFVQPLAMVAACSDPTFDVAITYERLPGIPDSEQLQERVQTLTVSVVDA